VASTPSFEEPFEPPFDADVAVDTLLAQEMVPARSGRSPALVSLRRSRTEELRLPGKTIAWRRCGSHDLEAKMLRHRCKIAVIVQQRMTMLDAKGADDDVGCFPEGRKIGRGVNSNADRLSANITETRSLEDRDIFPNKSGIIPDAMVALKF
jgi:hypothetical protein